ncbi:MAG: transposase [Anaerolineae bacterium]
MVVQCAVRDVVDIHIIPHLDLSVKRERGRVAPALQPCPPLAHAPFAFLYNLSERQTEQMVHENIPMKFFVGVAVDKDAPDHSTLTAFQARLKANGGGEGLGGAVAGDPPDRTREAERYRPARQGQIRP